MPINAARGELPHALPQNAVAIDFETADQQPDSACAVGLARIENGAVTGTLYQLLRPPRQRVLFTWVHGLTWPMLRHQPSFAEFWPRMASFLGDTPYFVAHNAPFDRMVLKSCLWAMGLPMNTPFLCTLKGACRSLGLPKNRLSDVCGHLGIELTHHHAASDALAAARIYLHFCRAGLCLEDLRIRD